MPHPAKISATVRRIGAIADGPVRVRDLVTGGVAPGRLRAAVAAGQVFPLRRGIVIPRPTWESATEEIQHRWAVSAALLAFPGAFASHESAARLYGLPTMKVDETHASGVPLVHVTRVGAARTEGWLRVHGCDTPPHFVILAGDVAVTSLVRTSIELAATRSLRRSVAIIDAAMRIAIAARAPSREERDAVHDAQLREWARRRWSDGLGPYAGRRWVTHVRKAVERADPASESVLESMSRCSLIDSGLPRPRCGVPVRGDDGRGYFADIVWDDRRVIGEADGEWKYFGRDELLREKLRQQALEGAGWTIVRWGWAEGVTDPSIMIARVRRALSQT